MYFHEWKCLNCNRISPKFNRKDPIVNNSALPNGQQAVTWITKMQEVWEHLLLLEQQKQFR